MFPKTTDALDTPMVQAEKYGTISFLFDFQKGDFILNDGRTVKCDGLDALKVWIEKILHTEKERFEVYLETEYGAKIEDLIVGNNYPVSFIESELRREIEDALLTNEKILSVSGFELVRTSSSLEIKLEVNTSDQSTNTYSIAF